MKAVVSRLAPLTPIIVPNSDENPSVKKNPGKRSLNILSIVAQARSSFGVVRLRLRSPSLASSAAALDLEVWWVLGSFSVARCNFSALRQDFSVEDADGVWVPSTGRRLSTAAMDVVTLIIPGVEAFKVLKIDKSPS
mmetsp:Transcript_8925/g.22522  ORF Transcript_8925/g.22522 Transcript_8925/m.22522 type:complete len:137 (-) Transcript_8925:2973-3383(-)